jgi:hypothetical protein
LIAIAKPARALSGKIAASGIGGVYEMKEQEREREREREKEKKKEKEQVNYSFPLK